MFSAVSFSLMGPLFSAVLASGLCFFFFLCLAHFLFLSMTHFLCVAMIPLFFCLVLSFLIYFIDIFRNILLANNTRAVVDNRTLLSANATILSFSVSALGVIFILCSCFVFSFDYPLFYLLLCIKCEVYGYRKKCLITFLRYFSIDGIYSDKIS